MTNPEDCLRSPYIIAMSDILSAIASTTESTPEPAGTHVTTPARYRRRPIQSLTPVQKKSSAASSVAISPQSTPPSSTAGHRSESPNSTTSFDSSVSGSAREEEDPRKHTGASTTSMRDHGSVKLPSKRTVTFDSSAKEQPGSPGSSIHTRYEQAHPQGSGLQQLKQPPDSTWNLSSGETRAEAPSGVSSSALQIYLAQVAQHIKTSQLQAAMLRNAQAALGDMDSRVVRATHEAAARQAENSQLIMEVEQLRSLMRTLLEENDKRRSQTTNQPGTVDTGSRKTHQEPNDLDTTVDRQSEEAPIPSISSSNKLSQSVVKQDDLPLPRRGWATPRARLGNWSRRLQRINNEKAHKLPGYARVLQYPVRLAHDCRKASSRDWTRTKVAGTERRRRGTSRLARKLAGKVLPFADFS